MNDYMVAEAQRSIDQRKAGSCFYEAAERVDQMTDPRTFIVLMVGVQIHIPSIGAV